MDRYFVVGNLAKNEEEIVRIASLLRGMESASQAVSVSIHRPYINYESNSHSTD